MNNYNLQQTSETIEGFDFSKLDMVLSEELSEKDSSAELAELQQNVIILDVPSLKSGVGKACSLFGTAKNEIEYRILREYEESPDPNRKFRIEFRKKLLKGMMNVVVATDRLTAMIKILFPKTMEGHDISHVEVVSFLRSKGIKYGIKNENIKQAVKTVLENYTVVQDIVVAKGKTPGPGNHAKLVDSAFDNPDELRYKEKHGLSITELYNNMSIEEIGKMTFPALFVRKGETIASTTLPSEGKPGINIMNEEIDPEIGRKMFDAGDNVNYDFDGEKITYVAQKSGYVELEGRLLNVRQPVWVSPDEINAYFVKLPGLNSYEEWLREKDISDMLADLEVNSGILEDKAEEINESFLEKNDICEFIILAQGQEPTSGIDAYNELFFDKDTRPGKIQKDGSIDFRDIERTDLVTANQMIAVKYLAKPGQPGVTVRGKKIPSDDGKDIRFIGINNVKTVKQDDKLLYYSKIEGIVDLVGNYGLSVNRNYIVKGNVDFNTGNVAFDGNVYIKGSVSAGFNVVADGDVTVSGSVNNKCFIKSGGNVFIKEGVLGKEELTIESKGNVTALFIQGAAIKAEGDIVVSEYIINTEASTKGKVFTPPIEKTRQARGSIIGSQITTGKSIVANSIGSASSTNTKVVVGFDNSYNDRQKEITNKLRFCEEGIRRISETLRLGYNDLAKFKELLKKLHPSKQKYVLEMFVKLQKLISIRQKLSSDLKTLIKTVENLPREAEIVVRNTLFPKVLIQIGEAKTKTDSELNAVRYRISECGKEILLESYK